LQHKQKKLLSTAKKLRIATRWHKLAIGNKFEKKMQIKLQVSDRINLPQGFFACLIFGQREKHQTRLRQSKTKREKRTGGEVETILYIHR